VEHHRQESARNLLVTAKKTANFRDFASFRANRLARISIDCNANSEVSSKNIKLVFTSVCPVHEISPLQKCNALRKAFLSVFRKKRQRLFVGRDKGESSEQRGTSNKMKQGGVSLKCRDLESLAHNHFKHTRTYTLRLSKDKSIPSKPDDQEERATK
jgi:hypothetical protein